MAKQEKGPTEEFKVKGYALLTKVREIVHEGNVRRVIIEHGKGKTLIEVPLTMVSWASWSRPSPRLSDGHVVESLRISKFLVATRTLRPSET